MDSLENNGYRLYNVQVESQQERRSRPTGFSAYDFRHLKVLGVLDENSVKTLNCLKDD